MALVPKTNQENPGGAERREDTSVCREPCKTDLEEFRRDLKEDGGDDMSCQPPRNPHAGIRLG